MLGSEVLADLKFRLFDFACRKSRIACCWTTADDSRSQCSPSVFVRVARMWVRSLHVSHGWCFLWRSTQAFHTYLALFQCDMRTDRACAPGLILYVYRTFMPTVYHYIAIYLTYECSKNRQEHHLPLPLPRRMVPEIPSPSTHQQRHVPTEPAY